MGVRIVEACQIVSLCVQVRLLFFFGVAAHNSAVCNCALCNCGPVERRQDYVGSLVRCGGKARCLCVVHVRYQYVCC